MEHTGLFIIDLPPLIFLNIRFNLTESARISLKDYKKRHTLIISIKKERLLFNGVTSLIIAYLKLLLTLCSRIVNLQSISLTKRLFYFCYNTHLSLSIDFQ